MSIKFGDSCPIFTLKNQQNKLVSIDQFIGKHVLVIYFYPKDETPGCTKEACSFRDAHQDFEDMNCKVFGISSDSVKSHLNFANKYKLNFDLLADTHSSVRKLFGVSGNLFGLIPGRVTYVIDLDGKVAGIFSSLLNAVGHIEEAKKMVKNLNSDI
jgi:thioredoxin-dependent peroxiredoxin